MDRHHSTTRTREQKHTQLVELAVRKLCLKMSDRHSMFIISMMIL